jgi:TPR repeat protein/Flp pilus assembly protein TadD
MRRVFSTLIAALIHTAAIGSPSDADLLAAAERGDASAMYSLGKLYEFGEKLPRDYDQARKWLQRAAEAGEERAMVSLGKMFLDGEGVPKDAERAANWFSRAVQTERSVEAFYWLGHCLENGIGLPKDEASAAWHFDVARNNGHSAAAARWLLMAFDGRGMSKDIGKAHELIANEVKAGRLDVLAGAGLQMLAREDARAEGVLDLVLSSVSDKGPGNAPLALELMRVGMAYYDRAAMTKAQKFLHAALSEFERSPIAFSTMRAHVLDSLAQIDSSAGAYAAAEEKYTRAMKIRIEAGGDDNPDLADSYSGLASVSQSQDKFEMAEKYRRLSLKVNEKNLSPDDPELAVSIGALAQSIYVQGRYADAGVLFEEALAKLEATLGPDHTKLNNLLNNYAWNCMAAGEFARAEALFQRSLAIRLRKAEGRTHFSVAATYSSMGVLYTRMGRYGEAESMLLRSLNMREELFGPEHGETAISIVNLGRLYGLQGKLGEAYGMLARALKINVGELGETHSDVALALHEQGVILQKQKKFAEAALALKKALVIRSKSLPRHPDTLETAKALAMAYRGSGKAKEARKIELRFAI